MEGIKKGATHCMIICDTWDLENGEEDFPLYIMPGENVSKKARSYKKRRGSIEYLKEVYNLKMNLEEQLEEETSMNF